MHSRALSCLDCRNTRSQNYLRQSDNRKRAALRTLPWRKNTRQGTSETMQRQFQAQAHALHVPMMTALFRR
jgi:hypothetical protein